MFLGTGTPNPDPDRMGPSIAIIVDSRVYIIDFGVGLVRRAVTAGIDIRNLTRGFLTHLHSDHTIGYPDFIFTPGIAGRKQPLEVYGPKGLKEMTDHIMLAYQIDLDERINGLEPTKKEAYIVNAYEIDEGPIYKDDFVDVEAFLVSHGSLEAYGYKFKTTDKTIVISGDTCPSQNLVNHAMNCDILIHEVYSAVGLQMRSEEWRKYHAAVHTSTYELTEIANKIRPELLILYHQLHWSVTDEDLVLEISRKYEGKIASARDLSTF